jgi:DinB superfamily
MEQAEKLELLNALQSGRDALGKALEGVDEGLARRKPSHGGWSILDCVEHMIESERYLLLRLQAATHTDRPFEKSRREAKIAVLAADRNRRIEAPEPVHPRGRYGTLAEATAAFDAARAGVISWVENCAGDPRRMLTDHPLIEGPVTCSETLIMIAAHPARHAKQIAEIRAQLSSIGESPQSQVSWNHTVH